MTTKSKTGILLVNLGTPDSPKTSDVRKYLREFLMDERVIDIPFLNRWFLINCIIAPFRAPKSAKEYQKLWTQKGSPLKFYGERLTQKLQEALGDRYIVQLAMRYQQPSIQKALRFFYQKNIKDLIVLPLFPQYASASTGSVFQKVMLELSSWPTFPKIRFIDFFYTHPAFLQSWKSIAQKYFDQGSYDHILFSYHGLPERQLIKGDTNNYCMNHPALQSNKTLPGCCESIGEKNRSCYRAQCFETSRRLAQAFQLSEGTYTTCFQSRLGKTPWIEPFTDQVIEKLANEGIKRILCFSPSFVADCLETTIEIGETYRDDFLKMGGTQLQLVESLNDHDIWIEALKSIILD